MPDDLTAPPLVLRRWDVADVAAVASAMQVSIGPVSAAELLASPAMRLTRHRR